MVKSLLEDMDLTTIWLQQDSVYVYLQVLKLKILDI